MTHPHLAAIATRPRPVGSEANAQARQYCADHLRSLGFEVAERPFEFSALPGRYGAQIIGAGAVLGYGTSLLFDLPGIGGLTVILLMALTVWLGSAHATKGRFFREVGTNLEATRGSDSPRVWLVAHIDTKSQPISSALRSIAVVALIVPLLLGFYFRSIPVRSLGIGGGVLLMLAAVRSKSDGAADNGSGVAAVLEAASMVSHDRSIGVLITDAEELALAGATAWATGREPGIALNCDTVDDGGRLVIFEYGYFSRAVDEHAGAVARSVDPKTRVTRPPPGVLTDSNAFHRAGWQSVTLARGTFRTLNRIHTRRDSLDSMRGTGIPDAARVLARLAEELA
ncbi:MAG TPA: M28 family peptidase [Gemmatimonadaceae bacterium]|nr:M28 family peptidase [Gemmatimonadaceae bacterium]